MATRPTGIKISSIYCPTLVPTRSNLVFQASPPMKISAVFTFITIAFGTVIVSATSCTTEADCPSNCPAGRQLCEISECSNSRCTPVICARRGQSCPVSLSDRLLVDASCSCPYPHLSRSSVSSTPNYLL